MDLQKIEDSYKSIPYQQKPEILTVQEWQVALRRQYAERHPFVVDNLGNHPVFSDFRVTNPENNSNYKVAIRSGNYDLNFCECMDFKTNGLGTCKHIEAILLKINENPSHKHILECHFQPNYSSVHLKYGMVREVKLRIGYEFEKEFIALAKEYCDDNFAFRKEAFDHFETFIEKAKSIHQSFRCYPDAMEFILSERTRTKRMQTISTDRDIFSDLVKTTLYDYQKQGVSFAMQAGRSLLADDMGLGKTIQALATAQLMKRECSITNVLIICPTSLKYQWKSEIEKFTGETVCVIEGNALKRASQYEADDSFYTIVSYNVVLTDLEKVNQRQPDLVILDEAQRIKNFKSKISRQVKLIKSQYAIVLTGTPLENKLEDLYSIMQFVDSFSLGPFYQFIAGHQIKDENGKTIGYSGLHEIGKTLSNVLLRRTRSQVLDQLPERTIKNLFVPITNRQMQIHDDCKCDVAKLIEKWKRTGTLAELDRHVLIMQLNAMRMVCDSSYLIDQKTHHDTKIEETMSIVDELILQGTEKAVIFSQWERMTRLIAVELDKRNINYQYLHGNVPGKDRGKLLDVFTKDATCKVFLSTDAGSVGLNLQVASLIINLDIPWSPAVLEQRISRIHRLGQKNRITVINLIAAGTIEQRMLDVIAFKDSLAKGVLDNGDDCVFMGESRFKSFIGEIEKIIDTTTISKSVSVSVDDLEQQEINTGLKNNEPFQLHLFDDYEPIEPQIKEQSIIQDEISDFIEMGIHFFNRYAAILSDEQKCNELLKSITETDSLTGRTYLKIPLSDDHVQKKGIALFAAIIENTLKQ